MPPIPLLTKLQLLEGNATALDVGTKDGKIAQQLAQLGFRVDAIDVESLTEEIHGINFEQVSLETFLEKNTKRYDIVIARHVLPFTSDPLTLITKLNTIANIFVFTCFGPTDDWKDEDHIITLTKDELYDLFAPNTIKHYSETFEETKTYKGDSKFWHYHTFVTDNRA
jgi:hypothetical protein